jgi:hypothetical protein
MAMKPAQRRRLALGAIPSFDADMMDESGGWISYVVERVGLGKRLTAAFVGRCWPWDKEKTLKLRSLS